MKTLIQYFEGLLDSDYDIQDSDVFTLKQMSYKCTSMMANDNWGRGMSDKKCMELAGVEISQANYKGINPYNGLEEYVKSVDVYHAKVSAGRDGMGTGKWRFAWMIRMVLDNCNDNPKEIEQFILNCLSKNVRQPEVNVRVMRNKILIKSKFMGTWGPASMSMTLSKQ